MSAPITPQGPVPAVGIPNSQDYPRLVFSAPRFETVAIAEIIQPSVNEAVEAILPSLIPPYIQPAVDASIQAQCVLLVGSTMTGPLNLSPAIPTANTMAATKSYVDTMVATSVPEVPAVPTGQAWARELGQWVPLASGGTVTSIATGTGLTGGPISVSGTISMANMAANSLKGNNTGAAAAPTDIPAGNVLTMIGAAPLNSPVFTGTPVLPTGTTGVTQPAATNNTSLATTAFVANGFLPLSGGRLSGGLASGVAATPIPAIGNLTLNANAVTPITTLGIGLQVIGADNTNAQLSLDCYGGASNAPYFKVRHARGIGSAPTAVQSGDYLFLLETDGYAATAYAASSPMSVFAAENWTAAANGTRVAFSTVPTGSTTAVSTLTLQGNTATFSGLVVTGPANAGPSLNAVSQGVQYGSIQVDGTHHAHGFAWGTGAISAWVDGGNQGNLQFATSDAKLKTEFAPIEVDCLDVVNQIMLQQFDWLPQGDYQKPHWSCGYTAQDIQGLIPEAVQQSGEDGPLGVDLMPLVAYLIGATQQLSARVAAIEGRA